MEVKFEDLADICYEERDKESMLLSASIVVKDKDTGEIRVYNSSGYGIVVKEI